MIDDVAAEVTAVVLSAPLPLPQVFCEHVPPQLQVAQRCRCRDWDVCGQQQVAVQLCLQRKQTGYPDFEDIV